jgi:hypothetical protein
MPLIQTVTVGNRVIDLLSFTGEVLDEKKWATTHVAGGGGGYNVGSGQQNAVTISSTTVTHDQFFLRDDAGQEQAFETANAGLALRKGHRVSVLWGVIRGGPNGPTLAIYNHTTGTLTRFDGAVAGLAVPPAPLAVVIAYVVSIFAICFYGLGIIALIVLLVVRSAGKKSLMAAFRPAVEAAIAQIKSQK